MNDEGESFGICQLKEVSYPVRSYELCGANLCAQPVRVPRSYMASAQSHATDAFPWRSSCGATCARRGGGACSDSLKTIPWESWGRQ
jgi:hypothetical protein